MKRIRNIWFNCVMIILSLHWPASKGQIDTICFNDTILYEVSASANSEYNWNIPGGTIIYSSGNMDSVIVVWNKNEGLHFVEVTKQSDNYCTGNPEVLEVFVYKPFIHLGQDMAICEGSSEKIVFDPDYKEYLWNNVPGTNEFTVSSEGVVTLEVKDKYGCWSKDNITVVENKNPVPDFMVQIDSLNRSVSLFNLSDSSWSFSWDFGDGSYSYDYNPGSHSYCDFGHYEISLTAQAGGCSGIILKEVNFPEPLISDFEAVYKGCAPAEVTFINHSTGAASYLWDFGNGESSVNENPKTLYKNPGIYEVSLYAENNEAVEISKIIIIIEPMPTADFDISPAEPVSYEKIYFYNRSSNATRYLWDFGDGEFSDLYEPTHSYTSDGEFDIILRVWSENGCSDSLFVRSAVTVIQDCRIIFPNGFIPDKNGPSGGYYNLSGKEDNNTIFHPLYRNIDEYELRIYNRWGEMVFRSNDIDIGWDGYYKGKLAPQDTYLYIVKSKCISGKEISTTGSITLIY
jgi:gliding motility-associated-like protein